MRCPAFQVVPFGSDFLLRCAECGEVKQVKSLSEGRAEGRQHQRWDHPTEDEAEADRIQSYEWSEDMEGVCERCGHAGHEGKACAVVHPGLLKRHA